MPIVSQSFHRAHHWQEIFGAKSDEETSWYEPTLSSLDLILSMSKPSDAVIDIGAGRSHLLKELGQAGYADLTALDLSAHALAEQARKGITTIESDICTWEPTRKYGVWHDRAVLHFLVDDQDVTSYVRTLDRAVTDGGLVVISTFGVQGPESCSGLPVRRYSVEQLGELFGRKHEVLETSTYVHVTPWSSEQEFSRIVVRR